MLQAASAVVMLLEESTLKHRSIYISEMQCMPVCEESHPITEKRNSIFLRKFDLTTNTELEYLNIFK